MDYQNQCISGWKASRHIRRKEIEPHREWMLRLWMPVLTTIGFEFLPSYLVVAWLCWFPNLLVAEGMIRQRRAGRQRVSVIGQAKKGLPRK